MKISTFNKILSIILFVLLVAFLLNLGGGNLAAEEGYRIGKYQVVASSFGTDKISGHQWIIVDTENGNWYRFKDGLDGLLFQKGSADSRHYSGYYDMISK